MIRTRRHKLRPERGKIGRRLRATVEQTMVFMGTPGSIPASRWAVTANKIIHIDMDAFFAGVEQMDNPLLKGLPVIVGALPDRRGVVCTASYEARTYGVHSAMPSRTAYKLCPQAVFVEPRMDRYSEVSERLMETLYSFTPFVEAVSIDEAFLDISGVLHLWKHDPVLLCRTIKKSVSDKLGLTASIGLGVNKFMAKLASDMNKPDGLTVMPEDRKEVLSFLAGLPVNRIFGVGKKTVARLELFGIKTIARIQELNSRDMEAMVGKACAENIWNLAHGIDDRVVEPFSEEKSMSRETTFQEDISELPVIRQTLIDLVQDVAGRMRRAGKQAFTVQIKIRYKSFKTITRQTTFPEPINSDRRLIAAAVMLLEREKTCEPVRLIGFGVSKFDKNRGSLGVQPELPGVTDRIADWKDSALDAAVDRLRVNFGPDSVTRGRTRVNPG